MKYLVIILLYSFLMIMANAGNLLINSDFSDWQSGRLVKWSSWYRDKTSVKLSRETDEDKKVLRILGCKDGCLSQSVTVSSGKKYLISATGKIDGSSIMWLLIRFYDKSGKRITQKKLPFSSKIKDKWQTISGSFEAPLKSVKLLFMLVIKSQTVPDDKAYIESLMISEIRPRSASVSALNSKRETSLHEIKIPESGKDALVKLRLGRDKNVTGAGIIEIKTSNGENCQLSLSSIDIIKEKKYKRGPFKNWEPPYLLQDAAVRLILSRTAYWRKPIMRDLFFRPNPGNYGLSEATEIIEKWDNIPSSTNSILTLRLNVDDKEIKIWLNGRYFTGATFDSQIKSLALKTINPAREISVNETESYSKNNFYRIPLEHYRRPGKLICTKINLYKESGIPFYYPEPGNSIDTAISRPVKTQNVAHIYYDDYYYRSPCDGMKENIMFRVPSRYYSSIWLLFALDPSKDKDPCLSVRISRYLYDFDMRGRGGAISDAALDINAQKLKEVRQVGEITETIDGKQVKVPLYMARIFLNTGMVADLLRKTGMEDKALAIPSKMGWTSDYLDIELSGRLFPYVPTPPKKISHNTGKRPLGLSSGFHIFAATLESLPFTVKLESQVTGNLFYRNSEAQMFIHTYSQKAQKGFKAEYVIRDFFDKTVLNKNIDLKIAEQETVFPIDLRKLPLGWYSINLEIFDSDNIPQWREKSSFVLLPPDTRKMKTDSPFGIWWFKSYHLGDDELSKIGPIFQKLGARHTCPSVSSHGYFGRNWALQDLGKYDISYDVISSLALINRQRINPKPLDVDKAEHEIKEKLKIFKGTKRAMIYHEHRLNIPQEMEFPPELLGKNPQPLPEKYRKRSQLFTENAIKISKIYRKLAPEIRLCHGNSHKTGFYYNTYLRAGFPKKYLDSLSVEYTHKNNVEPENQRSILWQLREMMKFYNYGDIGLSASYENLSYSHELLGERRQAEYYTRAMLLCLAFGIESIHAGLLMDAGSAYYYTHWGSGGLCSRAPLLTPHPSFAAYATLTNILDSARYIRWIPAGSPSIFCLEFKKNDKYIYAFWTSRGKRDVNITFSSPQKVRLINIVGGVSDIEFTKKSAKLAVSPSPEYLETGGQIHRIEAIGIPEYDAEKKNIIKTYPATEWKVSTAPDMFFESIDKSVIRKNGRFSTKAMSSGKYGKSLKLILADDPEAHPVTAKYISLTPKEKITIPSGANYFGIYVNGNSCWGRILPQFKDTEGKLWVINGIDFKETTYINFDSWRLVKIGLPTDTPGEFNGSFKALWTCFKDGNKQNDKKVSWPLTLDKLFVEMRTHVIHVTDMVKVPNPAIIIGQMEAIK